MDSVECHVKQGLLSTPKYLPASYMYDRDGFRKWTSQKESEDYYMNRAEVEILEEHAKEMVEELPCPSSVVDMGCGDAVKTRLLLNEMLKRQPTVTYYAVDISADYLQEMCEVLAGEYGEDRLRVVPVPGDYENALSKFSTMDGDKAIVFFGGQNIRQADQIQLLKRLSRTMSERDHLIISMDTTQNRQAMELAYKPRVDPGNHMAFNSILRLNKEFGNGEIDTTKFCLELDVIIDHDPHRSSVVRWLATSACQQTYHLGTLGITVDFQAGEGICLQESYKYTEEQVEYLFTQGNHKVTRVFRDKQCHVGIYLLKAMRCDRMV